MTLIGDTMMREQPGPKQLVRDVALAEEPSFGFAVVRLKSHAAAAEWDPPAAVRHVCRSPRRPAGRAVRSHHPPFNRDIT
jgi:hypothetical protein